MELNSMGIGISHESSFLIDRPVGLGDNLLLVFKSDAKIWLNDEWKQTGPNSFILFKTGMEQKYGAIGKRYANHYIHFNANADFFEKIGLWTGRPGYIQNIEEVENIFHLLSREYISFSEYHKENESLFLQLLLRKLAENQCEKRNNLNDTKHIESLTNLRSKMYSAPGKYKNIEDMAKSINLSVSHFQALYRDYFGISVYEDLLNARMSFSMGFLSDSNISVREISNLCGYESDTCFMRCFKKRVGMTPSEYRRINAR